jgi:hypothetical protein
VDVVWVFHRPRLMCSGDIGVGGILVVGEAGHIHCVFPRPPLRGRSIPPRRRMIDVSILFGRSRLVYSADIVVGGVLAGCGVQTHLDFLSPNFPGTCYPSREVDGGCRAGG